MTESVSGAGAEQWKRGIPPGPDQPNPGARPNIPLPTMGRPRAEARRPRTGAFQRLVGQHRHEEVDEPPKRVSETVFCTVLWYVTSISMTLYVRRSRH